MKQFNQAKDNLLQAQNDEEVQLALNDMREYLDTCPSLAERWDCYQAVVTPLRHEALEWAQAYIGQTSDKVPERVHGFLELLPHLQEQCTDSWPQEGDWEDLTPIRPLLNALPHCESCDGLRVAVSMAETFLGEHPKMAEAGYRRLLRTAEDELIACFVAAMASPKKPSTDWKVLVHLSLLSSMEGAADPIYGLDFLWFGQGRFTTLSPDYLVMETDEANLTDQILTAYRAWLRMPAEDAQLYRACLRRIVTAQILHLAEQETDFVQAMDANTKFCMAHLKELTSVSSESDFDALELSQDATEDVLDVFHAIYALGHLKDSELLETAWEELECGLEDCPYCRKSLTELVIDALMQTVLNAFYSPELVVVSPRISQFIRLYMALGMAPGVPGERQELVAWATSRDVLDV